ncbi:MAG: cyclic nucleotide-binding protein [Flavobacteriaceae bacterium]|nr:MAG: cyclic nucleotide-binding protein [Flavobacteriaceae bacterium]
MKTQLHQYLNRYVVFNDEEIDAIYERLALKTFKKKEYLLQEGQTCDAYYFVLSGLVRSYYTTVNGHEKITHFALENWWLTDLESFVSNTASYTTIQALEKTQILVLTKEVLESLYLKIPKLERLFRIITEKTLIAEQRRSSIYLQMSSRDRYLYLITNFPSFAQRVPQYMIASYLEITPEYLSELRKK